MRRSSGLRAILVFLSMLVAACGSDIPVETTIEPTSNLGGDGLPVQQPEETYGHFPTALTGVLTLESNGCWTIDLGDESRLIVFPPGFSKPPDDGSVMVSPEGVEYASGMEVDASGGLVPSESLPGVPDGFWGGYLDFCQLDVPQVVVVDRLDPAFEAEDLDSAQQVALLRSAEFTTAWECGVGFTISTTDQTAALLFYPVNADSELSPPVSFPDVTWVAKAVIGKNLMVNNCDDVIEGWEPERIAASEWPITGGALDFEVPEAGGCGVAGAVTADLKGISVETSEGAIDLGDLTIVNEAYECFAG